MQWTKTVHGAEVRLDNGERPKRDQAPVVDRLGAVLRSPLGTGLISSRGPTKPRHECRGMGLTLHQSPQERAASTPSERGERDARQSSLTLSSRIASICCSGSQGARSCGLPCRANSLPRHSCRGSVRPGPTKMRPDPSAPRGRVSANAPCGLPGVGAAIEEVVLDRRNRGHALTRNELRANRTSAPNAKFVGGELEQRVVTQPREGRASPRRDLLKSKPRFEDREARQIHHGDTKGGFAPGPASEGTCTSTMIVTSSP
jgi:hypothetical protein